MRPTSYTKRVNNRIIIASEGVDYNYKDYFKITEHSAFHVLHKDSPKRKLKFHPIKPGIIKMDKVYPLFILRKLIEAL